MEKDVQTNFCLYLLNIVLVIYANSSSNSSSLNSGQILRAFFIIATSSSAYRKLGRLRTPQQDKIHGELRWASRYRNAIVAVALDGKLRGRHLYGLP
jgi:hypothetical protein